MLLGATTPVLKDLPHVQAAIVPLLFKGNVELDAGRPADAALTLAETLRRAHRRLYIREMAAAALGLALCAADADGPDDPGFAALVTGFADRQLATIGRSWDGRRRPQHDRLMHLVELLDAAHDGEGSRRYQLGRHMESGDVVDLVLERQRGRSRH